MNDLGRPPSHNIVSMALSVVMILVGGALLLPGALTGLCVLMTSARSISTSWTILCTAAGVAGLVLLVWGTRRT